MVSGFELQIGLIILFILFLFEALLIQFDIFWRMRRHISVLLSILLGLAMSMLVMNQTVWMSILLVYLGLIHLILIFRLANNRMEDQKSRWLTKKSFVNTNFLILAGLFASMYDLSYWVQIFVVTILLLTTYATILKTQKSKPKSITTDTTLDHLPTVTLAIPSRNESYDLVQSLESALKIDYPKLEILVLDDCSGAGVNEIIKNFAHQGVIFLRGTPPAKYWLAKNWAYQQLLHNANGEYVVFAGVDVRMHKDSILQIISRARQDNHEMLSILPTRTWQKTDWYLLLQSLRYHRIFSGFNHIRSLPPPLSSCFVIKKEALVKAGGFNTCRNSIYPEKVIAKSINKYSFIIADNNIGITSVKSFKGQFNTAVRTYYPLAHMQPEKVAIRTLLLIYAVWLIMSGSATFIAENSMTNVGLIILILGLIIHWIVGYAINIRNIVVWTCQLPALIMAEIFIMHYSMFKYEFTDVLWKGRNVCIPLLRYEHRLPDNST